jgi:hypothetical protein
MQHTDFERSKLGNDSMILRIALIAACEFAD